MRHLSIAFVLSTLLLASICSAQNCEKGDPHVCGEGTGGYVPLWAGTEFSNIVGTAPMQYEVKPHCTPFPPGVPSCMAVTSGLIVEGPIDSEGSNAQYWMLGNPVLGIGSPTDDNLFVGVNAGSNNNVGSGNNTFLGHGAGNSNTTGTDNTFVGQMAGNSSTTGSYNTYVGDRAAVNNIGSYNTYLGYDTGLDQSGESNTLRLGARDNTIYAYISGVYTDNVNNGIPVLITPGALLGVESSSLRFKEQVRDMGDSTNDLMKLRPVTFFYKPEYENGQHTLQYGLIAEEVAKVYPELVAYDKDGKPYTVRYQYIATMLLNEVQKQYHRAEAQAELIKAQQQEIDGLKQQLQVQNAALQERLSRLEALARVERAAAH